MKYELGLNELSDQGVSSLDICLVYRRPVKPKSIVVKVSGWDSNGSRTVKGPGIHRSSALESLFFYAPACDRPGPVVVPGVTFAALQSLVAEPVHWPSGEPIEEDEPFDLYASVRTRHGEAEFSRLVRFEEEK